MAQGKYVLFHEGDGDTVAAGVNRLLLAIRLGPLDEAVGLSDVAYNRLKATLKDVRELPVERLQHPRGPEDRALKRTVRMVAGCLLKQEDKWELARATSDVIGHTDRSMVADIYMVLFRRSEKEAETSVWTYREIATELRGGATNRQAALVADVSHNIADQVAVFLGAARYQRDYLLDQAWGAVVDGLTTREFGEEVGVPQGTARDYMRKARELLGDDEHATA